MTASFGSMGARRRLRIRLRELRETAGEKLEEAASALGWSAAKIVRIEGGSVRVAISDLRALLAHYGVIASHEVLYLESLARQSNHESQDKQWWGPLRHAEPAVVRYLKSAMIAEEAKFICDVFDDDQQLRADNETDLLAPVYLRDGMPAGSYRSPWSTHAIPEWADEISRRLAARIRRLKRVIASKPCRFGIERFHRLVQRVLRVNCRRIVQGSFSNDFEQHLDQRGALPIVRPRIRGPSETWKIWTPVSSGSSIVA